MPRKPKPQEPITPQELSALNDKTTQDPAVRKYHVATDAKNLVGLKKRRRVLRIILGAVTAVLLILFIISILYKDKFRRIFFNKPGKFLTHGGFIFR